MERVHFADERSPYRVVGVRLLVVLLGILAAGGLVPLRTTNAALATASWLDPGWRLRRTVLVDNGTGATTLTGYQVKVALPGGFDFNQAQAGGNDIRFTGSDGTTLLSYWTEKYDPTTRTGLFWVKVPIVPAGVRQTIYMYYGNPRATAVSNGTSTFPFFDTFSNPAWTALPAMPFSASDLAAATVGGRFYLVGGYDNSSSDALASNWQFDPATNAYTRRASMPTARWGLTAAAAGGKIFALGGQWGSAGSAANEVYDPAADRWATRRSLPAGIAHQGITGCGDGSRIYLFYGGLSYRYEPASDTYTGLADTPYPVRSWATCAYTGGKVYLIGGYSTGPVDFTQIYDIASNRWTVGAAAPFALYGALRESPVVGGTIYLIQGQRAAGEFSSKVYAYNILTNSWSEKSFGPHAADGAAGGAVNGRVYTFGGRQDDTGPYGLNFASAYDPSLDGGSAWRQVTGSYEESGGLLRPMTPARGARTGPSEQIQTAAYRTAGSFVLEAQSNQSASGRAWNSVAVNTNAGRYAANLTGYQMPYNDFGVSPTATSIYRESGTTFSKLTSYGPAVTGSQRFKVVSTASRITLYRNDALALTSGDTAYRGGYVNVQAGPSNASTWDFLFTRVYSPVEPGVNLGNEQTATGVFNCPCSAWSPLAKPAAAAAAGTPPYELGTRFSADTDGYITGLRFYKVAGMAGTHLAHLWDATGTLLATGVYTGETAAGWQELRLAAPVHISAGHAYISSYVTAGGPFGYTQSQFAPAGVDSPPLHLYRDGVGTANGLFHSGGTGLPTSTWSSTNYWSDVVFSLTAG